MPGPEECGQLSPLLLLLLYIIWRVQSCGYGAFTYRLRTLGPVSLLRLGLQCGEVLLFCPWVCPPSCGYFYLLDEVLKHCGSFDVKRRECRIVSLVIRAASLSLWLVLHPRRSSFALWPWTLSEHWHWVELQLGSRTRKALK